MGKRRGNSRRERTEGAQVSPRGWPTSLLWAAAIVGASIVASATINPLFGRFVHWDWMAGIAPTGFAALALAFRRRWV